MSRRGNFIIIGILAVLLALTAFVAITKPAVLGLDLQGGAEVVLQAEPKAGQEVTQDGLNQAVNVLRTRVDSLGVSEPEIRKEGQNRISVALAGLDDPQRVLQLVGSTGQLYFLDAEKGLVPGVSVSAATAAGATTLDSAVPKTSLYDVLTAAQRLAEDGKFSGYYAFKKGSKEPLNDFPYSSEERLALDPNVAAVPEADREVLGVPEGYLPVHCSNLSPNGCPGVAAISEEARKALQEKGEETLYWYLYSLGDEADRLTGRDLDRAQADFDTRTGQPIVTMQFTDRGGRLFEDITNQLADRGRALFRQAGSPKEPTGIQQAYFQHFAVVLDGELKTTPSIDFERLPDGITGGSAQIEGLDGAQEAKDIALVLQSGSLPFEMVPVASNQVSATLGKASLREGLIAGIAGLVLVMIYLLVFYRFLGLVASIALVIYGALLYGLIVLIPVTMTLPGIAGMILTIGVAADANVVVFERIKEEVRLGKSVRAAISSGYTKGFKTILDANVVTLITAAVLFVASQASVRGFALMLALGVLVSMFTAVAATRALLGLLAGFEWFNSAAFMGASAKPVRWRFDFAGRKRLWLLISGTAILICIASIALRGLNEGIDFQGGTRVTVYLEQPASPDQIKSAIADVDPVFADASVRGARNAGEPDTGSTYTRFLIDAESAPQGTVDALQTTLASRYAFSQPADTQTVSASFGRDILKDAVLAFVFSMFLIVLYIWFRYDLKYALPMIVALLHDLIITIGVYSISGREVNATTVAAVLTVLGYSLYDTIIIFDRVRENELHLRKHSYDQIVNISLWETLTRSLNTSFITLLPILSLFLFGGATLQDFAFALLIGIASGAYSSFFIAAPLLSYIKGREPEWKKRRAGSDELPVFLRAAAPAPAAASAGPAAPAAPAAPAKAASRGAAPAAVAEPVAPPEAADDAELDGDLDEPDAADVPGTPEDAARARAMEEARRRRNERRQRKK